MKIAVIIMLFVLILSLYGCTKTETESFRGEGHIWTIGFDKREIIPDDLDTGTYYIAGYKPDNPATGLLDPQYVRAIWIDDNSGRGGVVMVAVDCIGLSRADVENMRKLLADFQKNSGCRSINIISTHTHAGIDTLGLWGPIMISGKSEKFMNILYKGVTEAIVGAYQNRKDGDLYSGSVEVDSIQKDSRDPQIYDKTIYRLRFEPNDNSEGLHIINFAAHPEALRSSNSLVSADFPCYMGRRIKEVTGDEFVFFPGAIGGLISTPVLKDDRGVELDVVTSTRKTGEILADAALGIKEEKKLIPSFNIITEVFDIPLENKVFLIEKFLGILSTEAVKSKGQYKLAARTEVSYVEIGDIKAVFVPGELFPELAYGGNENFLAANKSEINPLTLCDIVGVKDLMVFGLSNDEIGYIIPPNDFVLDEKMPYIENARDIYGRRHYEETNSLGPKTAEAIASALERLINKINN